MLCVFLEFQKYQTEKHEGMLHVVNPLCAWYISERITVIFSVRRFLKFMISIFCSYRSGTSFSQGPIIRHLPICCLIVLDKAQGLVQTSCAHQLICGFHQNMCVIYQIYQIMQHIGRCPITDPFRKLVPLRY